MAETPTTYVVTAVNDALVGENSLSTVLSLRPIDSLNIIEVVVEPVDGPCHASVGTIIDGKIEKDLIERESQKGCRGANGQPDQTLVFCAGCILRLRR